jgi:hypothetical protein
MFFPPSSTLSSFLSISFAMENLRTLMLFSSSHLPLTLQVLPSDFLCVYYIRATRQALRTLPVSEYAGTHIGLAVSSDRASRSSVSVSVLAVRLKEKPPYHRRHYKSAVGGLAVKVIRKEVDLS